MQTIQPLVAAAVLIVAPLVAQERSKGKVAVREKGIEIIQTFPVARPLFPFVPEDLATLRQPTHPALRLEKFMIQAVQRFEARYQHPPKDDLELAAAVTDWVASTMLHPSFYPAFTSPVKTYPANPSPYLMAYPSAVDMLEYVLKFNPKVPDTWPSPICDHQNTVVGGMLNLAGLHAQTVAVAGHTGLQYFSWTYGKWIWCEATFNEHYMLVESGSLPIPLGVMDLHNLTMTRHLENVRVVKHGYPDIVYLNLTPEGFRRYANFQVPWFNTKGSSPPEVSFWIMVSQDRALQRADEKWVASDPNQWSIGQTLLDAPVVRDPQLAHQKLDAIGLTGAIEHTPGGVSFTLRTLLPFTSHFEITNGDSEAPWVAFETVSKPSYKPAETRPIALTWNSGLIRIRAVDTVGNHSQEFIIRMTH